MMNSEMCFVCGSPNITTGDRGQQDLLERQLSAVFVLRKLVELPLESLEKCFLLSGGEDPADWITICGGQCQGIVDQAEVAYGEMCRARQKLMECQKEIQNKIRESSPMSLSGGEQKMDYRAEIYKVIRESLKKGEDPNAVIPVADDLVVTDADVVPKVEVETVIIKVEIPETEFDKAPTESVQPPADRIKCLQCDYTGKTKKALWQHTAFAHPKGDAIFHCDLCPQTFNSGARLTKHKYMKHKRQESSKKWTCLHCDYSTPHGSKDLNRHISTIHDNAQTSVCDICDKKFSQPVHLRLHQASHHNKCSVKNCGKICKSQKGLRDHQVNCHGKEVDLFKCPDCEMLYKERRYLREHLMIHHRKGNEDIYVCSQCTKTFATQERLVGHVKFVHKTKISKKEKPKEIKEEKDDGQGDNLILGI